MKLLEKVKIGDLEFNNRMVMAPMTRSRANADGTLKPMTTEYYVQRSSAGLLITEGINISKQAQGSPLTPGIFTQEQVESWKEVTEAVHAKGGKIFAQLWHSGRVGHSSIKGEIPVAPSAIAITGQQTYTSEGMKDFEVPRALETAEVKHIVQDYKKAAQNAKEAGFDGVELHGAFGYLPNQFLVDGANQRTDEYGGSIENRVKFILEVMSALVEVWGAGKAGIKLSPSIYYNSMIDSDPTATFSYLITKLNDLPLAYIQLMQSLFPLDKFPTWPKNPFLTFRPVIKHKLIINGGYTKESAEAALSNGADLVSFGALFLANPDLPKRFELGAEMNTPDHSSYYGGDEKGYIDYPSLN